MTNKEKSDLVELGLKLINKKTESQKLIDAAQEAIMRLQQN